MAIEDNEIYGLLGSQIKELPADIKKIAVGKARELTTDDYNWNHTTGATGTPDCIALWLLPNGLYDNPDGLDMLPCDEYNQRITTITTILVMDGYKYQNQQIVNIIVPTSGAVQYYATYRDNGTKIYGYGDRLALTSGSVVDNLASTSTKAPLSANQGKVLNEKIGDLSTLQTTDKTDTVSAINEVLGEVGVKELTIADYNWPTADPGYVALWLLEPGLYYGGSDVSVRVNSTTNVARSFYVVTQESSGNKTILVLYPTVNGGTIYNVLVSNGADLGSSSITTSIVQTTGTSTTSVMSQNATTGMVFADPSIKQKVQIGEGSMTTGVYSVAIGKSARATKDIAVALGSNTTASGDNAIAIGQASAALAKGSIAIGRAAEATTQGTVVFKMADNFGYNNTQYMLITGLYDPQSAHDAATKGYVDSQIPTITIQNNTLYL